MYSLSTIYFGCRWIIVIGTLITFMWPIQLSEKKHGTKTYIHNVWRLKFINTWYQCHNLHETSTSGRYGLTLFPAGMSNYMPSKMWLKLLQHLRLRMDKKFHLTLYNGHNYYISKLQFTLNHDSKRGTLWSIILLNRCLRICHQPLSKARMKLIWQFAGHLAIYM